MHQGRILFLCFLLFMSAGCEGKLAGISDPELQDNIHECNSQSSQSPGFAISCDNYRRECERRREAGRYVC